MSELGPEAFAHSLNDLLSPYNRPNQLSHFLEWYEIGSLKFFEPSTYIWGNVVEMVATLLIANTPSVQSLNEYCKRFLVFDVANESISSCKRANADILLQRPELLLNIPTSYDPYVSSDIASVDYFNKRVRELEELQAKLLEPTTPKV